MTELRPPRAHRSRLVDAVGVVVVVVAYALLVTRGAVVGWLS